MAYRHGVYVSEQDTSLTAPIEGSAGLQVIFGTAPINMVADPAKAVNTPLICYSFAEAVANVGYSDDFSKYTLCQSIDASFRVFNVAPIILINVLDPSKAAHVTDVDADFYTLVNGQTTLAKRVQEYAVTQDAKYKAGKFYFTKAGDVYTKVESPTIGGTISGTTYELVTVTEAGYFGVLLSSIVVKDITGATTYEPGTDYITSFDENGFAVVTRLSAGSIAATDTLLISYTALNPDGVTAADIIGGVNSATGVMTGLELVAQIYPRFGMTPGLLLAPGWASNPNVIAALQAKCENINGCFRCECIVDVASDATGASASPQTAALKYSDVKTAKESLGISSQHAIACWPKAKIGDTVYSMSALIAASIAYQDAANDDVPYLYPSNKNARITGTCLEDGTPVILDQEQANLVNSFGVVTALNHNGFVYWGNNTAAYPSTTDPKDRWIAVRRMFSWWANTLILTYHQRVDDPANYRLVENIVDSENIRGNSFVARQMVAEARCTFLESENPVTNILNGEITFHLYLTPFTPAENIEFILEFNPYALQTALTGGEA